jgi:hypothetical protein
VLPLVVAAVLAGANVPPLWSFASNWAHERKINSASYKQEHGFWQEIELPAGQRVNAIHAALLPTGKLLLIAGSGNKVDQFEAGTFKTLVFDPKTGRSELVPTPTDLFCAGHAFLPDGKLLVAGGTLRYEVLEPKVTRAAGTILVKNESPTGRSRTFPKGTIFVAPSGKRYTAGDDFTIEPAKKTIAPLPGNEANQHPGEHGPVTVTASETKVWVEAAEPGPASASDQPVQYAIDGLTGDDTQNIYGLGDQITVDKQDYQGRKESYEFNPVTERYERVADMHEKRWYPTLTGLPDGRVLAVSGLDGSGVVVDGSQNEIYDPKTKKWTVRKDLDRYFPTYPALFQTDQAGQLFYSGSNAGYGPDRGRDPGFWNLTDNSFQPVPGLRDADQLETSMSGWVGPVQNQTIMVVGGGGVGDSAKSTSRVDLIKLNDPTPRFTTGPDLPEGTRYPNLVQLPDDSTLITNGSSDYRGRGDSDNHTARIYHPDTNTLAVAADPGVGRNYHSAALLLPDGRVLTVGSDPLYRDEKNSISGTFEQRIEVFTPPYLFGGQRPEVTDGPATVKYGQRTSFTTTAPNDIATVRLIRPGAATHMLNLDQRSVAVDFSSAAGSVELIIPDEAALLPPGPYMLFMVDHSGVPSLARWVQVG